MTTEAQLACDKAMKTENYHKNIADLIVRLRAIPDEENKKLEEVLERAKPKADFYGRLVMQSYARMQFLSTVIGVDRSAP